LIHDINIWGDMSNFEGTVDPNNPFSGQSPRTDGLLDEIVDGGWYKKHMKSAKLLQVMMNSLYLDWYFIVIRQEQMSI